MQSYVVTVVQAYSKTDERSVTENIVVVKCGKVVGECCYFMYFFLENFAAKKSFVNIRQNKYVNGTKHLK